ncbi:MAG: hypothetical protein RJA51_1216 [Actinomycetota bacterium]
MLPSGFTPARVTVNPPAVNTSWLLTRSVTAFWVRPPIVAAPAADSVFTRDGDFVRLSTVVVVVGGTVVVVVATGRPGAARVTGVVVVVVTATATGADGSSVAEVCDGATGATTKVNSAVMVCAAYVSSAARVAVTVHFPAVAAVRTPLVIVHPAPPGAASEYETAPEPVPPVMFSVIPVPTVPVVPELSAPCTGVALENVSVMAALSER